MNAIFGLLRQFWGLFVWWTVILPWEEALRIRLGKHIQRLMPGLRFVVPHVDRVYRQNKRQQCADLPFQTLTTSDGKTLTLSGMVFYTVQDLERLYNTLHDPFGVIRGRAMSAIAGVVHANPAAVCVPTFVEREAGIRVTPLLEEYGLGDVGFTVTDFAYVRTYRLLGDQAQHYNSTESLRTNNADSRSTSGSPPTA